MKAQYFDKMNFRYRTFCVSIYRNYDIQLSIISKFWCRAFDVSKFWCRTFDIAINRKFNVENPTFRYIESFDTICNKPRTLSNPYARAAASGSRMSLTLSRPANCPARSVAAHWVCDTDGICEKTKKNTMKAPEFFVVLMKHWIRGQKSDGKLRFKKKKRK